MGIKFIYADELKKKYKVFGHFYAIELASGDRVQCRSTLEIVSKELEAENPGTWVASKADAVFIMMNPGSSKPLQEVDQCVSEADMHELAVQLVPAKPDTTQYQVMRVMHYCGWKHVRVLNLSDLREPKSELFIPHFVELERINCTVHSVFSESRQSELMQRLNRKKGAPIVCAWGVDPNLSPLVKQCMTRIQGQGEILGLRSEGTDDGYRHPLPRPQPNAVTWLADMVNHLLTYAQPLPK